MEQLKGIYVISVAARLLEMHPQTLRKYERAGLITPFRTQGMFRLYSDDDIARLRRIKHWVDEMELNLAGVELALSLCERLLQLRHKVNHLPLPTDSRTAIEQEIDGVLEFLGTTTS